MQSILFVVRARCLKRFVVNSTWEALRNLRWRRPRHEYGWCCWPVLRRPPTDYQRLAGRLYRRRGQSVPAIQAPHEQHIQPQFQCHRHPRCTCIAQTLVDKQQVRMQVTENAGNDYKEIKKEKTGKCEIKLQEHSRRWLCKHFGTLASAGILPCDLCRTSYIAVIRQHFRHSWLYRAVDVSKATRWQFVENSHWCFGFGFILVPQFGTIFAAGYLLQGLGCRTVGLKDRKMSVPPWTRTTHYDDRSSRITFTCCAYPDSREIHTIHCFTAFRCHCHCDLQLI